VGEVRLPVDAAILCVDLPEHGLQRGDVGTIVEVRDAKVREVEFLNPSGTTRAVVTMPASALRATTKDDVLAVRPHRRSA
jgi:hypothetical protein